MPRLCWRPYLTSNIGEGAISVLRTPDPAEKVRLSHKYAKLWRTGKLEAVFASPPPARPARPEYPELKIPRDMPRRRKGKSLANRITLLHAVTHIELNAIDLAWDIVARFGGNLPKSFTDDWVQVADDEARHFALMAKRLDELGSFYGALPAHDGLWQSALETRHDVLARLAIVPLVLEARGLDVTPHMIRQFENMQDTKSAAALKIIYSEEISHVFAGQKWFSHICRDKGLEPIATFQQMVKKYFTGQIKPPFNDEARIRAGFEPVFYAPLAEENYS